MNNTQSQGPINQRFNNLIKKIELKGPIDQQFLNLTKKVEKQIQQDARLDMRINTICRNG